MVLMRRYLIPLVLALSLAGAFAVAGQAQRHSQSLKGGPLTFKVSLIQEATYRHPNPPPGDAGDTFSTTLRLNAIGNVLGFPQGTPMGTMSFNWGPLNGACSSSAASCDGTTNIQTVTRLPGGTITAGGSNVSLASGIVVPVESGTGIFKGVKGSIQIAPLGVAVDIFKLVMPAASS
jgi:hypothetical protein